MPVYLRNDNSQQEGNGIFFDILRSGKALLDSHELYQDRPGFQGEKHGVFIDKGPFEKSKALFLGPGTQYDKRISRGDDKVKIAKLDRSAMVHDKFYNDLGKQLKNKEIDKVEFISKIHEADDKFIKEASANTETPKTARISAEAMRLKKTLEKSGVLPSHIFSGGNINTDTKEYTDMQRKVCYPCNILESQIKDKKQKGGIGPLLVAVLSVLTEKAITMIASAISKQEGSGIMDISNDLKQLPENKQYKLINSVISKLGDEAFDENKS